MATTCDDADAVFPVGGGRAGEAIRSRSWADSPLGPVPGWPSALRVALGLILNSPESMFLAWGPDLLFFHNDAYAPILGPRLDGAMGRPTADLWSDVWEQVRPIVEAALGGRPSRHEDLPMYMARHGHEEQTWWSFSYSPLLDERGSVAGLFCVTNETTTRVSDALKLRENQEVAAVVAEVGEAGSWYLDLATDEFVLSARMAALIGLPVEPTSVPPRTWRERVFDEDRAGLDEALRRTAEDGRPFDIECRVTLTNGRLIWLRSRGGVVHDASGRPVRLNGASVDVTERREVEERRREGEARLASALSIAKLGTFEWEVQTGAVILDDRSREIFGFADGEAVTASTMFDRIHPSDLDRVMAEVEASTWSGERLETEYRIALPDGTSRAVISLGEAITGPNGATQRMFGVFRDVTAQQRARDRQAFLLSLGDRLRTLGGSTDVVSVTTSLLGEQLCVGRCAYGEVVDDSATLVIDDDWTDGSMSSFTGRLTLDHFGPDIAGVLRDGISVRCDDVLRDERTRMAAKAFALVGGVRSGMAVPLIRDGLLRGLLFVVAASPRIWTDDDEMLMREVAERIWAALRRARAEETLRRTNEGLEARVAEAVAERLRSEDALRQAQKMEAVGQLTGGVAHDFNNLLTVIRSSVDLLAKPGLSEERRKRYLDAVSNTVDRAAKLTGQLLAFARRQALKPEVFDAAERVRSIADMLNTVTGARIRVVVEVSADPCHVRADPSQFETALVNMAVNARDAMDGEGTLTVQLTSRSGMPPLRGHGGSDGRFVALLLGDTGAGIAPETMARIFEPFFTTKEIGKGTGLGLSQVFGFAKQSGGDIDVRSDLGQGTTFTLFLPQVERNRSAEAAEPNDRGPVPGGDGRHVLVVEDNVEIGQFATQVLQDLGYRTTWAANAVEALDKLVGGRAAFDVVFSDVVMPGMNGVDLAREIRRRHPDLPVVLTSGYSHVLAEHGTSGFDLLHKPYSAEGLSRILSRALR